MPLLGMAIAVASITVTFIPVILILDGSGHLALLPASLVSTMIKMDHNEYTQTRKSCIIHMDTAFREYNRWLRLAHGLSILNVKYQFIAVYHTAVHASQQTTPQS